MKQIQKNAADFNLGLGICAFCKGPSENNDVWMNNIHALTTLCDECSETYWND